MPLTTVSVEDLERAAVRLLGERLGAERAREVARKAMEFFGYDDSIPDNKLSSKERDVFYLLEEVGLVSTFEDEVYVAHGKKWRLHYWVLNKDKIKEAAEEEKKLEEEKNGGADVYENLDFWGEGGGGENGGGV